MYIYKMMYCCCSQIKQPRAPSSCSGSDTGGGAGGGAGGGTGSKQRHSSGTSDTELPVSVIQKPLVGKSLTTQVPSTVAFIYLYIHVFDK